MALAAAATVGLATAVVALAIAVVADACVVAAVTAAVVVVGAAVVTLAAAVVTVDVAVPAAPQAARTSVEQTAMLVPAIARRQVRRVDLAIVPSQLSDRRAPHGAN
ncbi:MAG TPA: hypothetical protein VIU62_17760 [Chloroflexota bacterium]